MRRSIATVLSVSSALLFASSARADLPPPDGYVEQCTVEKWCPGTGTTCNALHGQPDATCDQAAKGKGLVQECLTYGATVSEAVYCPPGTTPPSPSTTTTSTSTSGTPNAGSSGCAIGGEGHASSAFAALASLVAIVALARRRRNP